MLRHSKLKLNGTGWCRVPLIQGRLALAGLCWAALPSLYAVAAPVWSDTLTGSQIDPTHWSISTPNPGVTITPSSMGVLMTMSSSASDPSLGASILSICALTGDFDVQVDYQLGPWPATSGVRTALAANDSPTSSSCIVERDSLSATADVSVTMPGSEVYIASIGLASQPFPDVATTDLQGTMRLTRVGSTETAYFATAGGGWTAIYSKTNNTTPVYGALSEFSGNAYRSTPGGGSSIYFRNYVVNVGQLSCPDAGASDGSATDGSATDGSATDGSATDAGLSADGGGGKSGGGGSSGCSCGVAAADPGSAGLGLLLLVALAICRHGRRRGTPAPATGPG